jgi:hypothetical protein
VDSTPTAFHRPGLVVSDWPSTRESPLGSPMGQIRRALVRRCGHRLCRRLRSLAVRPCILPWGCFSHRTCGLACCAEVVTLNGWTRFSAQFYSQPFRGSVEGEYTCALISGYAANGSVIVATSLRFSTNECGDTKDHQVFSTVLTTRHVSFFKLPVSI